MSTASDILRELMARVRREFYVGRNDLWFPQQKMVQTALTYPARWLHDRAVPLSTARYRQIMENIISTMARHGNLAAVEYRSRYILHCVQEHMKHHGDDYYQEGKDIRNRVSVFMTDLERRATKPATDNIVAHLSAVHDALLLAKRRPAKPAAPPLQPDLFASAKRRKLV